MRAFALRSHDSGWRGTTALVSRWMQRDSVYLVKGDMIGAMRFLARLISLLLLFGAAPVAAEVPPSDLKSFVENTIDKSLDELRAAVHDAEVANKPGALKIARLQLNEFRNLRTILKVAGAGSLIVDFYKDPVWTSIRTSLEATSTKLVYPVVVAMFKQSGAVIARRLVWGFSVVLQVIDPVELSMDPEEILWKKHPSDADKKGAIARLLGQDTMNRYQAALILYSLGYAIDPNAYKQ